MKCSWKCPSVDTNILKLKGIKMKPTLATTYLLVFPLISSLYFGIYLHVGLIFFSMIFSLKYHGPNGKKWEIPDSVFAVLLFFYNLYLLFLIKTKLEFSIPILLITLISFALWHREESNYQLNHSVWHVLIITGTFLCSLGYGLF